ncbi:MAG: PQQ-binding-like beta-propeller repeat protein [Verrucomicrobiales bacterium]
MRSPLKLAMFGMVVFGPVGATDWPRYLGPEGDSKVAGELGNGFEPKEVWTAELGRGCSGFAIAGGKAVVMGNRANLEAVWCFDAKSGELLWKHEYAEPLNPKYYDGGPSVTPTIDGNRVYSLSRTGKLFCLSLDDGAVRWKKDYVADFGGKAPTWGYAAAPVVRGGGQELYCLPCAKDAAVYVLDKMSGEVSWKFGKGKTKAGYSAPVFFKDQGKHAMAAFHGRQLIAYNLDDNGSELFAHTWRTSYDVNASNPQYHDGKMFFASGYGMGYSVIDVSTGDPQVLHKDEDTRMVFQNSILLGDDIVGVFGDKNIEAELIRMDLATGKVLWREAMPGTRGSSLMVGETMVILAETGDLIVGVPSPEGWKERGRATVLQSEGKCWAPLAYADGRVYIRANTGEAACLELTPE